MRFGICALLLACGSSTSTTTTPTASAPTPIEWTAWSAETFAAARTANKMILVDVGIEGCTACRWMFEDTYTDARVIERVRDHFVAVAVDANARPDLGERYSRWGWPATIVLSPDGVQVLAIRGNKRPRNFIPILDELIERHGRGALEAEAAQPIEPDPLPDEGWEALACKAAVNRIASRRHDEVGWDGGFTMVRGAPMAHAMLRAHARGETETRDHALRTAEAYAALIDPVWGGVFVGGRGDQPIVEKRTLSNAGALQGFAEAFRLTQNEDWLRYAEQIDRWFRDWMISPEGAFYATQEDDAPQLPQGMRAREYYQLGDTERREHGIPPIDHAIYADLNGRAIEAYAAVYAATNQERWLEVAERAADSMLEARRAGSGWIRQLQVHTESEAAQDNRMRSLENHARIYLSAQARMGLGFASLYNVTGEMRWLNAAREIVDATRAQLAADDGGFYASPADGTESIVPRRKPLEDNAAMARLLLMMASFTQHEPYRELAEQTLRTVASPDQVQRRGQNVVGEVALAYEWLTLGPIEVSIVAQPDDARARPLLEAAIRVWEPRKIVHFEPEGRYPAQEQPVVHVCTNDACSAPLSDPAQLVSTVETMRPGRGAPCE